MFSETRVVKTAHCGQIQFKGFKKKIECTE